MLSLLAKLQLFHPRLLIFNSNYDPQKVVNLFARVSEELGSSLDLSETISQICKVPVPLLADWSCLFVSDEKLSTTSFASCFHPDPIQNRRLTEYFQNEANAYISRPVVSNIIKNGYPATEILEAPSPIAGNLLTLPLIHSSEVLGLLTFGLPQNYASEDILLAEEVSRRAAIALYNSKHYQKVCLSESKLILLNKISDEANQAKSQFLANLSHEIRTPVSAILGFTDLLMEDHTPEERLDWGQRVKNNGHQLLRLINDLLDLSKIEHGQLALENEKICLNSFFKDLHQTLSPQARGKKIELTFVLTSEVPDFFVSDKARLQQILGNVIGNAIKFTDAGAVVVRAGFQKDSGFLYLEIEDTGPGLTEKEAAKLFQPFSQADTLHSKRHGGSGLGLALSANLARQLGGGLELVVSQPGKGSTFRVIINPKILKDTNFISELVF